uniref:Putative ribonuclease H-like domain-containing protein n=1 Tax=Tanacetum cinerariifolium TaxID=118510 RepID=A0A6L2L6M9_TANCI|nr:putative ribonuclease H-like domain-containing protein [Tanacetum cinerariifolium]
METQKPLLKYEDGEEVDVHMYRSMIGSLMYLTSSRPDIIFVVCACARYQVNPKVSHLHSVKRIFRYLKGQSKFGIWYLKDSPFNLVAYTDSDYAGASLDRKSTTGGFQFLGCRLISWQCKKQTMVANSMIKSEYVAASSCCGQRKNTELPQTSVPSSVADEAVNEEIDDSLERAITTATSLDAEHEKGGGLRCQEAIGDAVAQTKSKRVVLDLETTKTTQALEINSLKRRAKKLERMKKSRTHKLKRLYKVGLSARVESSKDKRLGEEDASKQRRIADIDTIKDIDTNKDIYLVNVHKDKDMFGVNDLCSDEVIIEDAEMLFDVAGDLRGEELFVSQEVPLKEVSVVDEVNVVSTSTTTTATIDDITLAKALMEIKSTKPNTIAASTRPKVKGLAIHEQEQAPIITVSSQQPSQFKDKGKGKMVKPETVKKLSKKDQLMLDEELAFKLQAEEEEQERLAREKAQQIKEVNIAWDDVQA